jgi:hypothetical protein
VRALQTDVLEMLAPRGVRHGQKQIAAALEHAEQTPNVNTSPRGLHVQRGPFSRLGLTFWPVVSLWSGAGVRAR